MPLRNKMSQLQIELDSIKSTNKKKNEQLSAREDQVRCLQSKLEDLERQLNELSNQLKTSANKLAFKTKADSSISRQIKRGFR